jgi:Mn2+/Fe2+ NRAMP family transporter
MKKALEVSLGIVTSVGGFLEIGSIATSAQAGSDFHFQLLWAVLLGTVCIGFLVEMSGRFAAVSGHTIADAIRERFGAIVYLWALGIMGLVSVMTLAAELGGMAIAMHWITGTGVAIWALPVTLLAWCVLWFTTFGTIENGVSLLGLVSVSFLAAMIHMHPHYGSVVHGLLPTRPHGQRSHYWFLAVSILGASIAPSLFLFYSSGAREDKWDTSYLGVNRAIATLGMGFGGVLAAAALVAAALVFGPRHESVQSYDQLRTILAVPFGRVGVWLLISSIGIACLGATLEVTLAIAYLLAQGLGWNWGEDLPPRTDARFALTYTGILAAAALVVACGVDPLKLTNLAMSLTAAALPVTVFPLLILMNDRAYLKEHTNGLIGNAVVLGICGLAAVLALVSIPLQILGG